MAQLIAFGLIGGLVWYAYGAFKKQMAKVQDELQEGQKNNKNSKKPTKIIDDLELGSDGVYRPKKDTNHKK